MTFSQEWEERYKANTHISIWPWSDVVSYVMRYAYPGDRQFRVLELGCGAGANIPLFQKLGAQYYGVEGSSTIVETLQARFPEFEKNIRVGDFTREIPFSDSFDLVIDRASLTHNTTAAIRSCLDLLYDKISPGGKFIGIDWFSCRHSDYLLGESTADVFTRQGYKSGTFANVGRVHFSDKEHLVDLFDRFTITVMEHKTIEREIPDANYSLAFWNFVAVKP